MAHRRVPVDSGYKRSCRPHPDQARRHMAKVSTQLYKVAGDAHVTPLSTDCACCGQLRLKRFRAKWIPVRVKKTRQNKRLERPVLIQSEPIRRWKPASTGAVSRWCTR